VSWYEREIMTLWQELERGEVVQQGLESELAMVRKEAHLKVSSVEEEPRNAERKLVELQAVLNEKHQQKVAETEKMFQRAQQKW
ncbi:Coiled-coil domain-containing protein 171, partial [Acanthisitta chloris]